MKKSYSTQNKHLTDSYLDNTKYNKKHQTTDLNDFNRIYVFYKPNIYLYTNPVTILKIKLHYVYINNHYIYI